MANSILSGNRFDLVIASPDGWQQAQLRVSGEILRVAIMLGNKLAKSSSITSV